MARALGGGAVAAAVVLPWTTPLRLSSPLRELALTETPLLFFSLFALLGVAALLARDGDPWLGAFLALATASVLVHQTSYALEIAQWIAFGALGLLAVRRLGDGAALARRVLLGAGLAQVGYLGLQALHRDPLQHGLHPIVGNVLTPANSVLLGTLGNENWVAAYLAILVPLASPPLAALFLVATVATKSYLGLAAATLGLLVHHPRARGRVLAAAGCAGAALLALRGLTTIPGGARLDIWRLGLTEWPTSAGAVLFGHGPGAWFMEIPTLQRLRNVWIDEWFAQAHNEVVQLVYEHGLAGLVCLAGFLWWHRAAVRGAYAGAVVALAVECLGMFPFRLATLGALAIVVLGLATAHPRPTTHAHLLDLTRALRWRTA